MVSSGIFDPFLQGMNLSIPDLDTVVYIISKIGMPVPVKALIWRPWDS